jgi:hypothetical protein
VIAEEDESLAAPLVIALAAAEPAEPSDAPELSLPSLDLPEPQFTAPSRRCHSRCSERPQLDEEALAIAATKWPAPAPVILPTSAAASARAARAPRTLPEEEPPPSAERLLHSRQCTLARSRRARPVALVEATCSGTSPSSARSSRVGRRSSGSSASGAELRRATKPHEVIRLTGKRPTMMDAPGSLIVPHARKRSPVTPSLSTRELRPR